jgi:predicted RNA-binding protein
MALMFGESEEVRLKQMLQDAYNDVPFIEHDEEEVRLKQMLQDAYNDVPFIEHDEEGLLLRNLKQFYQRVKVLLKTY